MPDEATIAHEVGHTALAYHQIASLGSRLSCSIIFSHRDEKIGPTAINPIVVFQPDELIMRSLAGIVCQAIHYPASVDQNFRAMLLERSPFETNESMRRGSDEALGMERHQSQCDWAFIIEQSKVLIPDARRRPNILKCIHSRLLQLMYEAWFHKLCRDMIDDIVLWLDEDQEVAPLIATYPAARVARVFVRNPRP